MNEKKIFYIVVLIVIGVIAFVVLQQHNFFIKSDTVNDTNTTNNVSNTNYNTTDIKTNADNDSYDINKNSKITSIAQIKEDLLNKIVTIQGKVISKNVSNDGHIFAVVKDATGEINVPIFSNVGITAGYIEVDKEYLINGHVSEYNGKLEVIPENKEDVKKVENDILEITENDVGKEITIKGEVLTKYNHPEGHVFLTVKFNDQEIEVPIFNNLNYNSEGLNIYSIVEIKGKVDLYKGKFEVIPQTSQDIKIVEPGDETKITLVDIKDINQTYRGKMVQVRGYVLNTTEKNGHLFFDFDDGNGNKIRSVVFRADINEIVGRKVKILDAEKRHYKIRVLAMVDIYENNLELIIDKVYIND